MWKYKSFREAIKIGHFCDNSIYYQKVDICQGCGKIKKLERDHYHFQDLILVSLFCHHCNTILRDIDRKSVSKSPGNRIILLRKITSYNTNNDISILLTIYGDLEPTSGCCELCGRFGSRDIHHWWVNSNIYTKKLCRSCNTLLRIGKRHSLWSEQVKYVTKVLSLREIYENRVPSLYFCRKCDYQWESFKPPNLCPKCKYGYY